MVAHTKLLEISCTGSYDIIIPEKIPALGPKNGGRLFDLRLIDHWFTTDTTGTAFMSLGKTRYPLEYPQHVLDEKINFLVGTS